MSNTPMIPVGWETCYTMAILCNGSQLIINADGTMSLEGSAKDAAMGIIKYVIQPKLVSGISSWELNHVLRIEFDGDFTISYLKDDKPEFLMN